MRVDFHDGEEFQWNPLVTVIQHIILGKPYIDHNGTLHVRSTSSGYAARLRFKEPFLAFSDKQVHQVRACKTAACLHVPFWVISP